MSAPLNIVESLVGLMLAVRVYQLWNEHRLDAFRQAMFVLRDELFDYAVDGRISFSNPAYQLLRKSINGFIRYGHQLSLFQLCVNMLRWTVIDDRPRLDWANSWTSALQSIPSEQVQRDLKSLHSKAVNLALHRLVFESPLLLIGLGIVTLCAVFSRGIRNLSQFARTESTRVVGFVVDPRIIEEDAVRSTI